MSFYGTIDALFAYAMPPSTEQRAVPSAGSRQSLEDLVHEKVGCLATILSDIQRDIKTRTQLSSLVLSHIDTYYCYLKSQLLDLYRWPLATSRVIDHRRFGIEKLLEALHREKRRELTECWQDIAKLRSEFRTWFKQYSDLVQRARLLVARAAPSEDATPRPLG